MVVLHHHLGYPLTEIAATLGIPVGPRGPASTTRSVSCGSRSTPTIAALRPQRSDPHEPVDRARFRPADLRLARGRPEPGTAPGDRDRPRCLSIDPTAAPDGSAAEAYHNDDAYSPRHGRRCRRARGRRRVLLEPTRPTRSWASRPDVIGVTEPGTDATSVSDAGPAEGGSGSAHYEITGPDAASGDATFASSISTGLRTRSARPYSFRTARWSSGSSSRPRGAFQGRHPCGRSISAPPQSSMHDEGPAARGHRLVDRRRRDWNCRVHQCGEPGPPDDSEQGHDHVHVSGPKRRPVSARFGGNVTWTHPRRLRRSTRSSGAAAGSPPSSSRSRRRRRRRRAGAAGTSRSGTCSRCRRSALSCESLQTSWLRKSRSAWPAPSSSHTSSIDARLARGARVRPGHPEEVELEVRAALDDREVVVEDRVRVGVADDDPAGSAPSSSKIRSWASPTSDRTRVGRDRQPGPPRRPRRRPMDALLGRRDPRLVGPDLADDPGPDARLPHPVGRLATSSSARSSTERRSMRASGG